MLLSNLISGAAKPLTRSEKFSLRGSIQPPMVDRLASACFCILSVLQAKPRCMLDGSAHWVPPSPSAVGRYVSVLRFFVIMLSYTYK
jgi:hypothetical protein